MKQKKNYYLENNIDRLLDTAQRRVEALKLQKEIYTIEARLTQLEDLSALYPPPAASSEPLGVHTAPSSDQENVL